MADFNLDTSKLSAAIRERVRYKGRTEAQIVNHVAFSVALKALQYTPFVPVSRIDAELNVEFVPGVTPSGKVSRAKKNMVAVSRSGQGWMSAARNKSVPLAALIVNSSVVRPAVGSSPSAKRYNFIKNFRYARESSPFRGVSRMKGRAAMRVAVDRLIRARRKSSKFLAAGWKGAIKALAPFVGRAPALDVDNLKPEKRGMASPAKEGASLVFATIGNLTGMSGMNATSFNEALQRHGGPALQRAIDEERSSMVAYMAKKEAEHAAKFNAMCS